MKTSNDVSRLDELINSMSAPAESQCELLREHLESARTCLLGSMQLEYIFSLQLAREAVNCVSNEEHRRCTRQILDELLAQHEVNAGSTRS